MVTISLHPRPRPANHGTTQWYKSLRSDAGGLTAERQVQVRYQRPAPDSPDRTQRDGIVLIAFALLLTAIAGLMLWVAQPGSLFAHMFASINDFLLRALPVGALLTCWIIGVRMFVRGAVNRAGKHTIRGTVIEHSTVTARALDSDDPAVVVLGGQPAPSYELYHLAIDDGTHDVIECWELPRQVHALFPLGTAAEAVVSGDERYVYSIAHAADV